MFKGKNWFTSWTNNKPKNPHSIDHLKYLYHVMAKNQTVSESNKTLLVETLRSISEILIWGDQNDSTVFDFFLEKNMLSFFLEIMAQKCGSYVCVQLLQTLNILFENIRNETSIYYLLSNNHVNSIIVHKFDFSDEEVMAYYISFLKTLSLKLNTHTIHFFFNENTNDFPLYTEAIKFFHHPEKMVRIAVRTLTLNVFKVKEKSMLKFVTDRTAAPYFSNLVWFIGNHVLEIDACLRKQIKDQQMLIRLDDLVAEHLDHLHYLNDILLLRIDDLNQILTDHLLNRLLIPLYIYSLITPTIQEESSSRPRISQIVSLFLVSQVFLIISYDSLVQKLVNIFLNGKMSIFEKPEFSAPPETLEESLVQAIRLSYDNSNNLHESDETDNTEPDAYTTKRSVNSDLDMVVRDSIQKDEQENESTINSTSDFILNETSTTDEEKETGLTRKISDSKIDRPFLLALLNSLDCRNLSDDHSAIFSLCLIYAMVHNAGVDKTQLYDLIIPNPKSSQVFDVDLGSTTLVNSLIDIIHICCQYNSRIRLITLEMCIILLKRLVVIEGESILPDQQLASIEQSKEEAALVLRNFFKSEEENLFLEMFEDENQEMLKRHLNVEYLMMDANLLLPPSQLTPLLMDGLELTRRLPCADVERTRYAIRVFLLLRQFSNFLRKVETPPIFSTPDNLVVVDQSLDLNHGDLIACTVITKDQPKVRRFMVIDSHQLILAEPDVKLIGWGIAKSVAFLQYVDINPDKDDSRSLLINIRQPNGQNKRTVLTAQFVFDDHIRCMAAKQRLSRGKMKAQQRALIQIAKLIDLQPITDLSVKKKSSLTRKDFPRSQSQSEGISTKKHLSSGSGRNHRNSSRGAAVPGFAVSDKSKLENSRVIGPFHHHHIKPPVSRRRSGSHTNSPHASSTAVNSAQEVHSRESSPKPNSSLESSEEMIPLDDLSSKPGRRSSRSLKGSDDRGGNVTSLTRNEIS
ncbi:protein CLEC16A homolog [Tetranychus urticae]|uniref:Uncharacterized protein n=1 Tax=Tetranychus urticae TaxID=32264 RepID=T1KWI7_TETUR|nr:protein CLEC16A homolog [Tetranychus urticae]